MKLFHKMFLCFVVIFGVAFQIAGYLMINFAYENAIEREKKFAFQEFQYNKYILQSILYSEPELLVEIEEDASGFVRSFAVPVALYGEDKKCIFSNLTLEPELFETDAQDYNRISFQMLGTEEENFIFVYDLISQGNTIVYFITETKITKAVDDQKEMILYFQRLYLMIFCIGFPVIFLLTTLLTRPIKKVSKAAKRIADGSFAERIAANGHDEIGELAANFNLMAEKVEEKVAELSESVRQKEDFAANFAHELKTPLTSVIGYADMLYQKELPRDQVKSAAEYILNEGMRLEALSLKLMDLFVLDKQVFMMEILSVEDMFENIEQGMEPVGKKYGVSFHIDIESGTIEADYDLFKTMILNLADNAMKADCRDIWMIGRKVKNSYQIKLKDNGKGIPGEELGRITEAFYMVDKSRARKQHGAGLGLALVAKIVKVHQADMQIESDGLTGTTVSLVFPEGKGIAYE